MGLELDGIVEDCGIVAAALTKPPEAYTQHGKVARFLQALLLHSQNRGQQGLGIVTLDQKLVPNPRFSSLQLVSQAFESWDAASFREHLESLEGIVGLGHVRYTTSKGCFDYPSERGHGKAWKRFWWGFNGHIANHHDIRRRLEGDHDYAFDTRVDGEAFQHVMELGLKHAEGANGGDRPSFVDVMKYANEWLDGAFSAVFMNREGVLHGVRDPLGFRPLCFGQTDDIIALASEDKALAQVMPRENIQWLQPGQVVTITPTITRAPRGRILDISHTVETDFYVEGCGQKAMCSFEHVYFANLSSHLDGESVARVRGNLGVQLAREEPLRDIIVGSRDDYIVVPVPDTSIPIAHAYARELGIESQQALVRNKDVTRTFIDGSESRATSIKNKFDIVPEYIKGKKVIIVDDSIVRLTTAKAIAQYFLDNGAQEVHFRIASPPVKHGCYYGIVFDVKNLIAAQTDSIESLQDLICDQIGSRSAYYISQPGFESAFEGSADKYCMACFTGKYPTEGGNREYRRELASLRAR